MTEPKKTTPPEPPINSPYGPQHGHIDDAAGGADSSPFETEDSSERAEAAHDPRQKDEHR